MNRGWLTGWIPVVVLAVFSPALVHAEAAEAGHDAHEPENPIFSKKTQDKLGLSAEQKEELKRLEENVKQHKAGFQHAAEEARAVLTSEQKTKLADLTDEKPNFFKGLFDLAIWTVVVFLLLLFVLGKFAWPLMMEGLEKRERAVAAALEKAQQVQADAEKLKAELDARFKKANDDIRTMMDEARRQADANKEEVLTTARAEIKAERERLSREIETKADQALQEMMGQVGQLATMVASKVIRRQVTEDDHRRLVDEALGELQQAAKERQRVLAGLS